MSVASLTSAVVTLIFMDVLSCVCIRRLKPEEVSLRLAGGSSCGSCTDKALFRFRAAGASYALFFSSTYIFSDWILGYLRYFSVQSWLLVTVYFTLAAAMSFLHEGRAVEGQGFWPKSTRACQLLLTTAAATTLMLDAVFWILLANYQPEAVAVANYSILQVLRPVNEHVFNFVLISTDLAFNSIPLRLPDLAVSVLWPVFFVHYTLLRIALTPGIASCLVDSSEDKCVGEAVFPYFFMDTSKPEVALWLFGLMLVFALAHVAMCLLSRRRSLPVPDQAPQTNLEVSIAGES